ncbi:MAG: hypothetical protein ACYCZF_01865 [Anaerolineae bacterium]
MLLTVATVALAGIFFSRILFAPNLYYSGDAARGYLPQRISMAGALKAGQFPWWEPDLGIGYPLVAEGEVAAFYPINWLILTLFPADTSLNASLLLHVFLAGLGMYLWLRRLALSQVAAYYGGAILVLGGFFVAHLGHLSILTVAAWLPWMLYLTDGLLRSSRTTFAHLMLRVVALASAVTLQYTGGHAQISLLCLILLTMYLFYSVVFDRPPISTSPAVTFWDRRFGRVILWLAALVIGSLVASPQLLSSWQLSQLSSRAGGLESSFFTSFSFHPLLLSTYILPFLRGNPYPNGSVELLCYLGLLPLSLAALGTWSSPRKIKWFFVSLVVFGIFLAFGRWNPIYPYLLRIPIFNLFRVPARFLLWSSVGLVGLAVLGLEVALAKRGQLVKRRGWLAAGTILAGVVTLTALVITRSSADELVALWQWLPLGLAMMIVLLWVALSRIPRWVWISLAGLILVLDLYAYGAVLDRTFNTVAPIAQVRQAPVVAVFLAQDQDMYRLYTKEEILPISSVQKESFYPNYGTTYGFASANLYMPLIPANYQQYLLGLSAARLDALNVRYYLIPQLLPVDEASELYDVYNPYASLPYNRWLEISPTNTSQVRLESYLSHSADLQQGDLAAELILRSESGITISLPIRAGIESAEWAFERPDVAKVIAYSAPPYASTFPARSGFPAVDHLGHTYLASWVLSTPMTITALYIRPILPEAYVRLEQVHLLSPTGQNALLNHLLGLGDHHIAYRSEDVMVYRNADARPRAYTVATSEVQHTGDEITIPMRPYSLLAADILEYDSQRVTIGVTLSEPSYLVLADLMYPGWRATVDGHPAQILLADTVFRAVLLDAGEHIIEFHYHFIWLGR